jgi:hypothetical protein
MRENPAFPALSRVSEGAQPNAGMPGWSERIRTRAFLIEPGLCVRFPEFGNMAGVDRAPLRSNSGLANGKARSGALSAGAAHPQDRSVMLPTVSRKRRTYSLHARGILLFRPKRSNGTKIPVLSYG